MLNSNLQTLNTKNRGNELISCQTLIKVQNFSNNNINRFGIKSFQDDLWINFL